MMTELTPQFLAAVRYVSELAHVKLPTDLHGVVERGTALVLNDMVRRDDGGMYSVLSSDGHTWYSVNGHCTCHADQFTKEPEKKCKHRWAVMIYKRSQELCEPPLVEDRVSVPSLAALPDARVICYATLIQMARADGLRQLDEQWLSLEPTVVTAKAIAVFEDGRRFSACGHASLENVDPRFHKFLASIALTRAKSRCLKDALGIGDQYTPEELHGGA